MAGKRKGHRKPGRKRVKPRNPLVPIVRAKPAAVVPSKRAYVRKPKHKRPESEDNGGSSGER